MIEPLRDWCFFWDWDTSLHQVRWMTAWDTTPQDIKTFAHGVAALLAN
jgi:threonine aldolase